MKVDMNTVHGLFMYKLENVCSKVCKIILRELSALATMSELQLVESKYIIELRNDREMEEYVCSYQNKGVLAGSLEDRNKIYDIHYKMVLTLPREAFEGTCIEPAEMVILVY